MSGRVVEKKLCGCGQEYAVSHKDKHFEGIRHRFWLRNCAMYDIGDYEGTAPPLPKNWKPDPSDKFEILGHY
jgi:hypothetical protein